MDESRVRPALRRGVLILIGLAATVIVVAGLHSIAHIVGPVFLALVLTIAVAPIRTALVRRGVPRRAGTFTSQLESARGHHGAIVDAIESFVTGTSPSWSATRSACRPV